MSRTGFDGYIDHSFFTMTTVEPAYLKRISRQGRLARVVLHSAHPLAYSILPKTSVIYFFRYDATDTSHKGRNFLKFTSPLKIRTEDGQLHFQTTRIQFQVHCCQLHAKIGDLAHRRKKLS